MVGVTDCRLLQTPDLLVACSFRQVSGLTLWSGLWSQASPVSANREGWDEVTQTQYFLLLISITNFEVKILFDTYFPIDTIIRIGKW